LARYTGPVCKLCRREGEKLFLKGERCVSSKCAMERRARPPGSSGERRGRRRARVSGYGLQLREKQKTRRVYGVLERQFRRYFREAERRKGLTGANLLQILESRLDNVVYRMGFGDSRAQARQLVQHGHIDMNGRRTKSPSALVKPGDVISVRDRSRNLPYFKELAGGLEQKTTPEWISLNVPELSAVIESLPSREQIDVSVNERLIVGYYSR
jgi:small subunit ribosomal protein S4